MSDEKVEKILFDFYPKKNYVIDSINLKWLVERNLITIDEYHYAYVWSSGKIIKPYIEKYTKLRQQAQDQIKEGKNEGNNDKVIAGESLKVESIEKYFNLC
jgi:hypothetical protein